MNTSKVVILGLLATFAGFSAAHARGGLLGTQYIGVEGGYERLEIDGESFNGWGAGAEINTPMTGRGANIGYDFNLAGSYAQVDDSEFDFNWYGVDGLFRGYMQVGQTVKPFAGVGLGWRRAILEIDGERESDSSFFLPAEVGVELVAGAFSLTPFYRYTVALESGDDDFWSIGATALYRIGRTFGIYGRVTRTDFDDGVENLSIRGGLIFGF